MIPLVWKEKAMFGWVVMMGSLLVVVNGFYIPGVQPKSFTDGESVEMKVNAMSSVHTQIPKDYYRLPFCLPDDGPTMASENLGEFLTGNKIQSSPYVINMLTEVHCKMLCQRQLSNVEAAKLRLHISYGYHHNWIIDNLPSAYRATSSTSGQVSKHYAGGFPIGFMATAPDHDLDDDEDAQKEERRRIFRRRKKSKQGVDGTAFVYNHVNIVIDYFEQEENQGYRVVGFAVEPFSIQHSFQGGYEWDGVNSDGYKQPLATCPTDAGQHMTRDMVQQYQKVAPGEKIIYTYDVQWEPSDVEWSSRWDVYLSEDHLVPAQVHWYSITNSILVVLFLSLLVVSILLRDIRRDIAAYNAVASALAVADDDDALDDSSPEETGWKLVHADVFRPPSTHPMMYCVFVGSGVQLGVTVLFAIVFSAVGFLSPARRGSLMTALLVFYILCGIFAGYVSARLYKAFRGRKWQLCTIYTATLFPGVAFIIFLFFNIYLFFLHSSASVPVLDVLIMAAMWCCVSIPLVFLGAYFGYGAKVMEFPTVTSTIARAIPTPAPYLNPKLGIALCGVIPFAAAYVELFFIMTSLWMDQFYYVFGFTLVVYLIILLTCAEVTVLAVYYQLCAENHRWWWFSFFASGSTSLYIFLYSVFWFKTLEASKMVMTYLLYFGYMTMISVGFLLIFGATGSLVCLWFVRKIFGSIKVD